MFRNEGEASRSSGDQTDVRSPDNEEEILVELANCSQPHPFGLVIDHGDGGPTIQLPAANAAAPFVSGL